MFVNVMPMGRLNISLTQGEFVAPGKKEIDCH